MQLTLKQLDPQLNKALLPVYLISGDVPLLQQEARQKIRDTASKQGFQEYQLLTVEAGFDWSQLANLTNNFNLFSSKIIVDCRNASAKFDDRAVKIIQHYLEIKSPDTLIIFSTNKLTAAQKRTRWYKALDAGGAVLTIWPVSNTELPRWIQARLQTKNLSADHASIKLLAELTEGNLLATQQAIEKLQLLYAKQKITEQEVMNVISNNARYHVFDLCNFALQGDKKRVVACINNLHDSGAESTFVLWALTRELRNLINLNQQLQQGTSMQQVLSREWQSRKPAVQAALKNLSSSQLLSLLQNAMHIDHVIKGITKGNAWDELMQLSLALARISLFPAEQYSHATK